MPAITSLLTIAMAPAPSEIVEAVYDIEIETSVDQASILRIRLGIEQTEIGDWSILFEDIFRPLVPVSVRAQVGSGVPEALINGYVTTQRVTYADEPGGSVVEVTGMDATLLMNLEEKVRSWPNVPDSGVAAAIFGEYALAPIVEPTSPVLVEPEATTIQRGSDIRFLRRLAGRNGFECYVQPEPISGIDTAFFRPPQLSGPPQAVLSVNMGLETNVGAFNVHYDMLRPTTAVASSLDVATKTPQPALSPAALETPLGLEGALMRVVPPPIVRPADTGLMKTPELQGLTQSIVDRSSWAVVASGDVDPSVAVLRPGGTVNVRGAGRLHNGTYYVTRVTHRLSASGYTQSFEARRNAVAMTGAELFVEV